MGLLTVLMDDDQQEYICTAFVINIGKVNGSALVAVTSAQNICESYINEEGNYRRKLPKKMSLQLPEKLIELDVSSENVLISPGFKFELNDPNNMAMIGLQKDESLKDLSRYEYNIGDDDSKKGDIKDKLLKVMGYHSELKMVGYPNFHSTINVVS